MKITKTTTRKHHTLCDGDLQPVFNLSGDLVLRIKRSTYGEYDEHSHKMILSRREALDLHVFLLKNINKLI